MAPRTLTLPPRGTLMVSTDLHGNLDDFEALKRAFLRSPADTIWLNLGDAVHGPSEKARAQEPALYDFPDESATIVAEIAALRARFPDRVLYVLGNHDYGHIGGPHTRKFHDDEVAFLEARMTPAAREQMRALFSSALLGVVAPCGAFLSHGSPSDLLRDLADLDRILYPPTRGSYEEQVLESFLCCYGQQRSVTDRLLATVSRAGVEVRMLIQGHDRDEAGWFVYEGNQGCPVIFGAPRANKRYLRLDLAARYPSVQALRHGHEIVPVHG